MRISLATVLTLALLAGTAQAQNATQPPAQNQSAQNNLGNLSPTTVAGIAGGVLLLGLILGTGDNGNGGSSTTTTTTTSR